MVEIKINISINKEAETVVNEVKIPLNPYNFIRLDGQNQVPTLWVDGDITTSNNMAYGNPVPAKERVTYYDFRDLTDVVVSKIRIYDKTGSFLTDPMLIYGIDYANTWTLLVSWDGSSYNLWKEYTFTPLKVAYLALTGDKVGMGDSSTEFEIHGTYKNPSPEYVPPTEYAVKPTPFKQLCGTNTYPWSLLASNAGGIVPTLLTCVKQYHVIRVYHDWRYIENAQGIYTFNKSANGGWRMDLFYQACKDNDIIAIPTIQMIPTWLANTWSTPVVTNRQQDGTMHSTDIWAYKDHARAVFNFAARYGNGDGFNVIATIYNISELPATANENDTYLLEEVKGNNNQTVISHCYTWKSEEWKELLSVKGTQDWTNDELNSIKIGLNTLNYVEVGNESNRSWHGRDGMQLGNEHAAQLSAVYDGHMGTMGDGIGVKSASSNMKVTTTGMAGIHYNFIMGIIYWSMRHRGVKKDGTVNVPFDAINFHSYRNTQGSEQHEGTGRKGMAPEPSGYYESLVRLRELCWRYLGEDFELMITETGYDLHPDSPQSPILFANYTQEDLQGIYLIRTMFESARAGIDLVVPYEIVDNVPDDPTLYNTSGMNNIDRTPRVVTRMITQLRRVIDDYVYDGVVSLNPVRCIRFKEGENYAYAIWLPIEYDGSEPYVLDGLPLHTVAKLLELDFNSTTAIETPLTVTTSYNVTVTEVPLIVLVS